MKERISVLMDGELEGRAADETIDALRREGEALDAWRIYHLISDGMRDTRLTIALPSAANDYLLAHQGFSPRVSLQGMAPYVRTVAEHPDESAK
jgi:hypothetical protein